VTVDPRLLDGSTFRRVRWKEGYDTRDVDAYLAGLRDDLQRDPPRVGPDDVLAARFRTTRLSRGYHQDDVEAYLDEVIRHLGGDARRTP
jgi:DivIVA domain-containing protein